MMRYMAGSAVVAFLMAALDAAMAWVNVLNGSHVWVIAFVSAMGLACFCVGVVSIVVGVRDDRET